MNFVRKYAKVLLWGVISALGLCSIGAFASGDFISGVLLLAVTIALLPVSPIQNFWQMLPEKFRWVKGVGLSALFLIGMSFASPTTDAPEKKEPETAEQAIVMTENQDKNEGKPDQKTSESVPGTTTKKAPTTTTKAPATTTKAPTTTTKAPTTTTKAPVTTTTTPPVTTTMPPVTTQTPQSLTFVVNKDPKSKKIHYSSCQHAKRLKPENRWEYTGSIDSLLSQGYTRCGTCFK